MSYTAFVLDEESANFLKDVFSGLYPKHTEWKGHHMTLHMGEPNETTKLLIGQQAVIVPDGIAFNDKVVTLKIGLGGNYSDNEVPHVTLAVNPDKGGKAVMSNDIPKWQFKPWNFSPKFALTGEFKHVK